MSEDSLINDEQDYDEAVQPTSSMALVDTNMNSKLNSLSNGVRSINHDEHIKLVKQKKEEADELRLQRFQEQLRKKDQKCQQHQLVKVKTWLQLRNRDTDHRSQVEERRRKREEQTKVKIEQIFRREQEREQKANSQIKVNRRGNGTHRPDSIMSMSIDVHSGRRAISAPRLRSNPRNMTNRRGLNDSPVTTVSQDNGDNASTVNTSHQLSSIDERRRHHRSRRSYDATRANEDNSLSGTPRTVASSRTRPMPTSYTYWLNTGDNNNNVNANFMRLTYAATCRSRLSRSVERCPRACRVHDDVTSNSTTTTINGESQRRVQSVNRQHLNETILRLSKPKTIPTTQSVHSGSTTPTSGLASSQSSHQLRVSTPLTISNNHLTPTASSSSKTRRTIPPRPASAASTITSSSNDFRASPTAEGTSEPSSNPSSSRQSSHRNTTTTTTINSHPKLPLPPSSKPPTASRSKPPTQRSLMTVSLSSSSVLTATTATNKQNIRRIVGVSPSPSPSPSKPKSKTETISSIETTETESIINDDEDKSVSIEEHTQEEQASIVEEPIGSLVEPINIDTVTEILNPTAKREQQTNDEQEYQRKLNQKIREAQQRLEIERQREEERQRQLELEEYEREQEQIRLAEELRRVEQERLQRAIEERERENELKRQEEQRLQQQREELERKQTEEAERLNRERQERIKKEEEERNERKKRLDLIMRRTRQTSPSSKVIFQPENNISNTNSDETNGHDKQQLLMSHSISDNRLPTLLSNENFLNTNESTTPDASKFKSPLIQNLLNKARNTQSVDNLTQSNMTTSQIMDESMADGETVTIQSPMRSDTSDDDDQQDSEIDNTTNGHSDSPLSSSTNLNSSHDRPVETATNCN
ncbi:unnamed protein product [Rotaria magnacalcarata]|uniref:Ensconsin-like n=1 Tax=Rotaria magnacalcarata TaxID=392030 RepID=A0A816EDB2_9BILA|nr:unnamed protein product [Rotaria magnacalcarata]CAF1905599.1 unnamed protein product [Rotaria magnacalcarata]